MLITFDLDGVLIKNPFELGVFPEYYRLIGCNDDLRRRQVWSLIDAQRNERVKQAKLVDAYDWDDMMNRAARSVGYADPIDVEAMVVRFCKPGVIWLLPHVQELLAEIQKNHQLMVMTNGYYKYQYPVLNALGIDLFFDEIVTPEKCGYAKPQVPFFEYAAQRALKEHQLRKMHVGDTVIHDVLGANRAGFESVWVCESLPQPFESLSYAERALADGFDRYIQELVSKEEYACEYIIDHVNELRPKYVVKNMMELQDLLSRET